MKKLWTTIRNIGPIPDWLKNTFLLVLFAIVCTTSFLLITDKEYDKLIAILSIFVAICSSSIFNVRAELEKYIQTLALEKKHEAYQELCCLLHKLVTLLKLRIKNSEAYNEAKMQECAEEFFQKYNFEAMYFSKKTQEELAKILESIQKIQKGENVAEQINSVKNHSNKITEIFRSELGLNKLQE